MGQYPKIWDTFWKYRKYGTAENPENNFPSEPCTSQYKHCDQIHSILNLESAVNKSKERIASQLITSESWVQFSSLTAVSKNNEDSRTLRLHRLARPRLLPGERLYAGEKQQIRLQYSTWYLEQLFNSNLIYEKSIPAKCPCYDLRTSVTRSSVHIPDSVRRSFREKIRITQTDTVNHQSIRVEKLSTLLLFLQLIRKT